jgi:hypothetical protein
MGGEFIEIRITHPWEFIQPWVQNTAMIDVLLRHYPELRPAMRGVTNAFQPWVAVSSQR